MGDTSDGCCGRGGDLPAAWLHLPCPGGDDPSEARASRPFLPTSLAGTARFAPPIGCRSRDASDSANQRGEARFGNFFPLGPGAAEPSHRSGREGPQEAPATGREGGRAWRGPAGGSVLAVPRTQGHPHASSSHWLHLSAPALAQE